MSLKNLKKYIALVLCAAMIFCSVPLVFSVNAETTKETVSMNGVQIRGYSGISSTYYLVLQSTAFDSMSYNSNISGAVANSTLNKIRLYTSADDTTGTPLSDLEIGEISVNLNVSSWKGLQGLFINIPAIGTTYGGHQVYKIVIEKDCELYVATDTVYVVDKDYTYINNSYGNADSQFEATNWTLETNKQEISLTGIQIYGTSSSSYFYYLVLKSNSFAGMTSTDSVTDNGSDAVGYTTLDKIRLYTSAEDTTGTALSDLTVYHIGINCNSDVNGAYINVKEIDTTYGGHQIYKVVIEKGCEIYVEDSTSKIFVVDKDYTYYNNNYGDEDEKLSASDWIAVLGKNIDGTIGAVNGSWTEGEDGISFTSSTGDYTWNCGSYYQLGSASEYELTATFKVIEDDTNSGFIIGAKDVNGDGYINEVGDTYAIINVQYTTDWDWYVCGGVNNKSMDDWTVRQELTTTPKNKTVTLKAVVSGGKASVYVDGKFVFELDYSAIVADDGKTEGLGLWTKDASTSFTNVKAAYVLDAIAEKDSFNGYYQTRTNSGGTTDLRLTVEGLDKVLAKCKSLSFKITFTSNSEEGSKTVDYPVTAYKQLDESGTYVAYKAADGAHLVGCIITGIPSTVTNISVTAVFTNTDGTTTEYEIGSGILAD